MEVESGTELKHEWLQLRDDDGVFLDANPYLTEVGTGAEP